MSQINLNYLNLKENYLFAEIARKVAAFTAAHPEADVIRMGIGDVTRPLTPAVISAMQKATAEMGSAATFHGYGDEQGYPFLQNAIAGYYRTLHVALEPAEIFISDGAKSDLGNILDLFAKENTVLIPDPVYPVYVDTNLMDGRKILFLNATEENGFLPPPPEGCGADLIYLCSPNNPTGAAYSRAQLQKWVAYAQEHQAVILFDAAYERFITDPALPHSIFEIEGAGECAIEFCSFSKTAGFTGTRCGYTVVPFALRRNGIALNALWRRRQTTKFNGVCYIVQRGAEAVFTPEGAHEIQENIAYYQENARLIMQALRASSISFYGGVNSPYIWMKCPQNLDSWQFFDLLLQQANVVGTPGEGFGENGKSFFRLTAFSTHEKTKEAMERLQKLLG